MEALAPEDRHYLELYQRGQYARLLGELEEPLKDRRATPGMLGLAALACTALGRADEAADLAAAASRAQPGWAWLHGALAAAEGARGDLQRALAAQRQAVRLAPGDAGCRALLARYERLSGQAAAAAETAREALRLDPAHAGARNELGLALLARGDRAGALEQFRRARELAPDDPYAYYHEGLVHLAAGARAEARRCFRAALRRSPDLDEAEEALVASVAGRHAWLRGTLLHLLAWGRLGLMGWCVAAFFYYVGFRVLQMLWNYFPGLLPAARALLQISLVYLLGAGTAGRLLRWLVRLG